MPLTLVMADFLIGGSYNAGNIYIAGNSVNAGIIRIVVTLTTISRRTVVSRGQGK